MATLIPLKLGGATDLSFITAGASQIRSGYVGSNTEGAAVNGSIATVTPSRSGNTVSWSTGYIASNGNSSGTTTSATRDGNKVSWGTGWITSGSSAGTTASHATPSMSLSGNTLTVSHTTTTGWVSSTGNTTKTYYNYRHGYYNTYTSYSSSNKSFYTRGNGSSNSWVNYSYLTVAYPGFTPNFLICQCKTEVLYGGSWGAKSNCEIFRIFQDSGGVGCIWVDASYGFNVTLSTWTSGNAYIPVAPTSATFHLWVGQ